MRALAVFTATVVTVAQVDVKPSAKIERFLDKLEAKLDPETPPAGHLQRFGSWKPAQQVETRKEGDLPTPREFFDKYALNAGNPSLLLKLPLTHRIINARSIAAPDMCIRGASLSYSRERQRRFLPIRGVTRSSGKCLETSRCPWSTTRRKRGPAEGLR